MIQLKDYIDASKEEKFAMVSKLINESIANLNQAGLFLEFSTKSKEETHRLYQTIFELLKGDIRKVNYYFREVLKNIVDEDLL